MILVTGATGTVGRQVVAELARMGAPVRALVRDAAKAADLAAEIAIGDFDDRASLAAALAGCDHAFLLIGLNERNPEQTATFLDAAREAGVAHIVRLSALGADAQSPILLGRHHAACDAALAASGIGWTSLQPANFHQNVFFSLATIKGQNAMYLPCGDGKVGSIDARDVAAVAALCLTEAGHMGQTYRLTGPAPIRFADMAREMSRAAGRDIRYVPVPEEAARQAMLGLGMDSWYAETVLELYAAVSAGYTGQVTGEAERLLGRPPRSFAQFADDYAEVF
jgi:uncharacterized protein YbjT (DUF2867 family)